MQLLIFVFTIFCCYYSTSNTYCCISMCKLPCTKKYKLQNCRGHFGHRTFKNSTWMQRMQFILTQLFLTPSMHPEQKITSVVKKGHTSLTINILFCGNMSVCFFEFCWWVRLLLPSLILLFRFIYVPSKCQEVLDCSGTSLIKPVNLRCRYIMSHPTNYHILQFSHLTYYSSCYLLSMTCILRHFGEMMTLSVTPTYFIYKICAGSVW